MFGNQSTEASVTTKAVSVLANLRDALKNAQDFYLWVSSQTDVDLEGLGFAAADVSMLKSAAADANELAVLYNGGGLGTYTLPYNFSASQRLVIGP